MVGRNIFTFYPRDLAFNFPWFFSEDNDILIDEFIVNYPDDEILTYLACGYNDIHSVGRNVTQSRSAADHNGF